MVGFDTGVVGWGGMEVEGVLAGLAGIITIRFEHDINKRAQT